MNVVEMVLEEVRALRELVDRERERERERATIGPVGLPQVLTMRHAARELSVSQTTLKLMCKRSEVLTVRIGNRRMVPASEIRRLASIHEQPKPEKVTRSGLQDPAAGRASLRRR